MSNHVGQRAIDLFHKQRREGKERREAKAEARRQAFEERRAYYRAKAATAIQEHDVAVLVFIIGLMLIAACIGYVAGMIYLQGVT